MQLAQQLFAAGLKVFPVTAEKRPANKGWQTPAHPTTYQWPTDKVGVVVPEGVYLVDLDTYKGITRQAVEQHIGCALPWDRAFIQRTAGGGEHYAFRTSRDDLRQGANIDGLEGFDSRRAGAGFFVTGEGYTPQGFGVFALASVAALPELPTPAAERLAKPKAERPEYTGPAANTATVQEALRFIDPDCSRDEWRNVGFALKAMIEDEAEGLRIFDEWSSGEYTDEGECAAYSGYEDIEHQFLSFKALGGITGGTLYHMAMAGGWRPPAAFDAASVFGKGAASVDVYCEIIDEITAHGGDPKKVQALVEKVMAFPCSSTQRRLLMAALQRELKEAGLLTKDMRHQLEENTKPQSSAPTVTRLPDILNVEDIPERQISHASADHGDNALLMIGEVFGDRLATFNGVLRWWSGCEWQKVPEEKLKRLTAKALLYGHCKAPNVSGTMKLLPSVCDVRQPQGVSQKIYFRNGVFDITTGILSPHEMDNNNTGCLTVDYVPSAPMPEFNAHMVRLFGGLEDGQERVQLLQEVLGWSLVTDNLNIQKIIVFDGASRGGKGVILEALNSILGAQKSGIANFGTLHDGKTQSVFRAHDVVFDFEAKSPPRQEIKTVIGFANKVASNEPVSIQLLNTQDPWAGKLNCKMYIACNGVPAMIDDSGASAARFLVLRFDRSFADREDTQIGARMQHDLTGIAAWAVEGLKRLVYTGRFTMPESSKDASDELRDETQPLREFIDECCEFEPTAKSHLRELYGMYDKFCRMNGETPHKKSHFNKAMKQTLLGSPAEYRKNFRIGDATTSGFVGFGLKQQAWHGCNVVPAPFGNNNGAQ